MTPESMKKNESRPETVETTSKLQTIIENDPQILDFVDKIIKTKNEIAKSDNPFVKEKLEEKKTLYELGQKQREQEIKETFFAVGKAPETKKEWTEDEVADALERAHQRGL